VQHTVCQIWEWVTTTSFDLSYSAKVTDSIDLTVAYAFMDADVTMVDDTEEEPVLVPFDESNNVIRVIGRYNF